MKEQHIEVCVTPAIYNTFENPEAITIVVDILRATSSICTAFINGVNKIIPVGTLDEAQALKAKGYRVAAERDGIVRDFADFGNSPFNFSEENVKGNDIVYSTTNGTNTINIARNSYQVLIGAYLNITALKKHLCHEKRDVIILCAGWKEKFNLEDTLFAGALAQLLLDSNNFNTICDATKAAIDLWHTAKPNLMEYINKTAQRERLRKNNLDDCIEYCHTFDLTNLIPVLKHNYITVINR